MKCVCILFFLLDIIALGQSHEIMRNLAACPANSIADTSGVYCCPATCGQCGGPGCNTKQGGAASCCTSEIKISCATQAAPCLATGAAAVVTQKPTVTPAVTLKPTVTPAVTLKPAVAVPAPATGTCPTGSVANATGLACCPVTCGTCGGIGCDTRPGGSASCCTSQITRSCAMSPPPCLAASSTGTTKPVTTMTEVCPAGGIPNSINTGCCPATCGTCGGAGCNKFPGGSANCCSGQFTKSCVGGTLPCLITGGTVTAQPTTIPTTPVVVTPAVGDKTCVQTEKPPGVKIGSCMEVTCMPTSVAPGEIFHTTLRWCLQRPRNFYATINLLDLNSKEYFTGTGFTSAGDYQCGEHTFELVFNAKTTPNSNPAIYDIMWKWFITPMWGSIENGSQIQDPFPNMLAETGIAKQPAYGKLVNDCPILPNRFWNMPATGVQDAIDFEVIPTCITPGQAWVIQIKTHLESRETADFHTNMMIGTGGDLYLGPNDKYVTETNTYGLTKNGPNKYWTVNTVTFSAAQTALLTANSRVYVSGFLTPAGEQYGDVPTGFTFLETEYFLSAKMCKI